jgi:hypothetical protein
MAGTGLGMKDIKMVRAVPGGIFQSYAALASKSRQNRAIGIHHLSDQLLKTISKDIFFEIGSRA